MSKEANDKSLESWIWDAACSIRGAKDAPKYKDYILPLIFTKRLCDVFDDELNVSELERARQVQPDRQQGRDRQERLQYLTESLHTYRRR